MRGMRLAERLLAAGGSHHDACTAPGGGHVLSGMHARAHTLRCNHCQSPRASASRTLRRALSLAQPTATLAGAVAARLRLPFAPPARATPTSWATRVRVCTRLGASAFCWMLPAGFEYVRGNTCRLRVCWLPAPAATHCITANSYSHTPMPAAPARPRRRLGIIHHGHQRCAGSLGVVCGCVWCHAASASLAAPQLGPLLCAPLTRHAALPDTLSLTPARSSTAPCRPTAPWGRRPASTTARRASPSLQHA